MVILVAGATGFLGSALARSLARRGHAIIGTTRDPSTVQDNAGIRRWIKADYAWDHDVAHWLARVEGVERALRRLSTYLDSRWRKQFELDRSVRDLIAHDAAFAADFREFFPALQTHVAELEI